MKKIILPIAILTIVLTGCATNWSKPGATQQSFSQDKYQCLQQSSYRQETVRQVWTGSSYKPVYDNNIQQDPNLFNTCMMARGYSPAK